MLPFPDKKYDVILADPPWNYDFSTPRRQVENHYDTMTLDEIKELPVSSISSDACVLYLWATAPKLIEALDVMKSWEFTYKTQCIWDKEIIGMGFWFRGQHEMLLVGTKGKTHPPAQSDRDSSVYRERRGRHSAKPSYYQDRIEAYFPNASRIELFARTQRKNWDAWGNEVTW